MIATPLNTLAPFAPLLALPVSGRSAWQMWRQPARQPLAGAQPSGGPWVPVLLGCGTISYALGQGIATDQQVVLHRAFSFPSWADAGYLGAYPFLLAALLVLFLAHGGRAAHSRDLLDSLMTTAAVAPFGWYVIVGPITANQHTPMLAKLTVGAHALCGLALLFGTILASTQHGDRPLRPLLAVLLPAMIAIAVSDNITVYQRLHGAAPVGGLADLTRALGYLLLALAGSVARVIPDQPAAAGDRSPGFLSLTPSRFGMRQVWRCLLPYLLIAPVMVLLAVMGHAGPDSRVEIGVYLGVALLIELIFVHQLLAYRELIAAANRSARLESLAGADPVTGLPNHRTLVACLDRELERARRYGHPCVLLFLDLDHFKALNDTFGHPAGDAALREFSSVVRSGLRGSDTLGRWGGEEFLAILPQTDAQAGLAVAERVRSTVAAHGLWSAGGSHVTCSVGLASYPDDAQDRDGLIELADQAMYAAKRLGRNQVRMAGEPLVVLEESKAHQSRVPDDAASASMVEGLAALVNARDHGTGKHIDMVGALAVRLAVALGLDTSQARLVGLAGRLHDIGKVAIPDDVLRKPTGLTEEEWVLMRQHPAIGAGIVGRVAALRALAPTVRAHHERWDGGGYPDHLCGEAIPLPARILSVADAFCAMRTERPYQPARDLEAALSEVRRCSGSQFDPRVVEALERVLAPELSPLQDEEVA